MVTQVKLPLFSRRWVWTAFACSGGEIFSLTYPTPIPKHETVTQEQFISWAKTHPSATSLVQWIHTSYAEQIEGPVPSLHDVLASITDRTLGSRAGILFLVTGKAVPPQPNLFSVLVTADECKAIQSRFWTLSAVGKLSSKIEVETVYPLLSPPLPRCLVTREYF